MAVLITLVSVILLTGTSAMFPFWFRPALFPPFRPIYPFQPAFFRSMPGRISTLPGFARQSASSLRGETTTGLAREIANLISRTNAGSSGLITETGSSGNRAGIDLRRLAEVVASLISDTQATAGYNQGPGAVQGIGAVGSNKGTGAVYNQATDAIYSNQGIGAVGSNQGTRAEYNQGIDAIYSNQGIGTVGSNQGIGAVGSNLGTGAVYRNQDIGAGKSNNKDLIDVINKLSQLNNGNLDPAILDIFDAPRKVKVPM